MNNITPEQRRDLIRQYLLDHMEVAEKEGGFWSTMFLTGQMDESLIRQFWDYIKDGMNYPYVCQRINLSENYKRQLEQ